MKKLLQMLMEEAGGADFPSLSPTELLILQTLVARGMYGQELVAQSEGQLKRGTVYVTLSRMEAKGLIESEAEARPANEGGLPRRRYRVTGEGQHVLERVAQLRGALAGRVLA